MRARLLWAPEGNRLLVPRPLTSDPAAGTSSMYIGHACSYTPTPKTTQHNST